jgi:hypothetical protein
MSFPFGDWSLPGMIGEGCFSLEGDAPGPKQKRKEREGRALANGGELELGQAVLWSVNPVLSAQAAGNASAWKSSGRLK